MVVKKLLPNNKNTKKHHQQRTTKKPTHLKTPHIKQYTTTQCDNKTTTTHQHTLILKTTKKPIYRCVLHGKVKLVSHCIVTTCFFIYDGCTYWRFVDSMTYMLRFTHIVVSG